MRYPILAGLLLLNAGAQAVAPVFVSVEPFSIDAKDHGTLPSDMFEGLMTSCLSGEPSLAVVERTNLAALTVEKSKAISGLSQPHAQDSFLNVHYVVTGSSTRLGGKWLVTLQASDPATTQTMTAYSATLEPFFYRNPQAFCDALATPFANRLLYHAAQPVMAETEGDAKSEESALVMQGIALAGSGDYAHAFAPLLKALDRNSHNAEACYWLAISYAKADLMDFAHKQAPACFADDANHPKRRELELLLAPKTPSPPVNKEP